MALLDALKKKKKTSPEKKAKGGKMKKGEKKKKEVKKKPKKDKEIKKKETKEVKLKKEKKVKEKAAKKEVSVPGKTAPSVAERKITGEVKKREVRVAPLILKGPQITEKATELKDKNQYVFKVADSANKSEIKKAVEEVYGVKVIKVRTIKVPRRKRRLGRSVGWKKGYKKAVVSLKKDQTIDIMPR